MAFDSSRTIGKAFDTYFEKILWKELKTEADETVVQVEGVVDIDFLVLKEAYKKILKSIKIIAYFGINTDKTVQLNLKQ